jgi:hypothetical protein
MRDTCSYNASSAQMILTYSISKVCVFYAGLNLPFNRVYMALNTPIVASDISAIKTLIFFYMDLAAGKDPGLT